MIKRGLFQKNKVSDSSFRILENADLKSVSGGVTTEESNESEQSKETVTQENLKSTAERMQSLASQIQGESTIDIRNDFPENVSLRHSSHDLHGKDLEKNSVKNIENESDTANAITIRMKEHLDNLTQDKSELQTPSGSGNSGSECTSFDDYLENAGVPKTEGINEDIDLGKEAAEAATAEVMSELSRQELVQANQDASDILQLLQ